MNEYYAAAGLYTVGFNQMQTDTCFSNFLAEVWTFILLSISVVRNACSRNAIFFSLCSLASVGFLSGKCVWTREAARMLARY